MDGGLGSDTLKYIIVDAGHHASISAHMEGGFTLMPFTPDDGSTHSDNVSVSGLENNSGGGVVPNDFPDF